MTKQPIYVQIASKYRGQIEQGELSKGTKLPSVEAIRQEWNVSARTVTAAMQLLKSEGLIETRVGSGAVVRNTVPLVRIAPERYFRPHNQPTWLREAERAGRTPHVQHQSERIPAPAGIAERLDIGVGDDVIRTLYLIKMDDRPVTRSAAYEPCSLVGGTPIERPHEGPMANRGIVPRFDAIDIHIDRVDEVLHYRSPTESELAELQLQAGVAVVEITQTFRAQGTPCETADIVFLSTGYELHYRMAIPVDPRDLSTEDKKTIAEGRDMPWPHGNW